MSTLCFLTRLQQSERPQQVSAHSMWQKVWSFDSHSLFLSIWGPQVLQTVFSTLTRVVQVRVMPASSSTASIWASMSQPLIFWLTTPLLVLALSLLLCLCLLAAFQGHWPKFLRQILTETPSAVTYLTNTWTSICTMTPESDKRSCPESPTPWRALQFCSCCHAAKVFSQTVPNASLNMK